MNHRITNTLLAITTSILILLGCQKTQPNEENVQKITDEMDVTERKAVSQDELIAVLETKNFDLTISVMNRVKMTHYKGDLIPLLKNIWAGKLVDIPNINKVFVDHPRIRLEIANVLLQASRNDLGFDLEPNSYNEYARSMVHSKDKDVAIQAISILNIANNPADLFLLKKLVEEENSATFRIAVIAFTNNRAATQIDVERVAEALKSSEIREYLMRSG
ncbi:MAG: hypothetical protein WC236_11870 [Gallionellaceae bacterium]|jgi:hypothetical protein